MIKIFEKLSSEEVHDIEKIFLKFLNCFSFMQPKILLSFKDVFRPKIRGHGRN